MTARISGCPPWCVKDHTGEELGSLGYRARGHSRMVMETHKGEDRGIAVEIFSLENLDQPEESTLKDVS
ncbi:hypothetical protein [Micromonospora sp. NPDC004704]